MSFPITALAAGLLAGAIGVATVRIFPRDWLVVVTRPDGLEAEMAGPMSYTAARSYASRIAAEDGTAWNARAVPAHPLFA